MTTGQHGLRTGSVVSADGTPIGYSSLGDGPGLIIVGGCLAAGPTTYRWPKRWPATSRST